MKDASGPARHADLLVWFSARFPNTTLFNVLHRSSIIIAGLMLSACSQPIIRVQYVPTKVYLPIPAELTLPVTVDLTGMTYGEGLGSLRAGLQTCDGQLASIRVLTHPSPPHK